MARYVIFALPRSRTAWLAKFLSYGEWHCGHEELRHMRSLDDVEAWLSQPCTGTIETAGSPWWRLLGPDTRIAVIRRPVAEVVESMLAIEGCNFDRAALEKLMVKMDRKLDQIERRIPCLSVNFHDLTDENTCAELFEYCLPYGHDHDHWKALADTNIQIDMPALMRYFQAYRPALEKLASIAMHKTLAGMTRPSVNEPDGVTFQNESFDTWLSDAQGLFDSHLVKVGEAPSDWKKKNIDLMRRIDEIGAMQITTARSNGRMFGYLMTLIAPSLHTAGQVSATHTTFFASDDFPGLGLKLQRASLSFLKERGVNDVFMRAGVRGSGDRIDTIYRRLGAENNGQEYRLVLAE